MADCIVCFVCIHYLLSDQITPFAVLCLLTSDVLFLLSAAYQFASVGIAPCAINTSAAVGTSFPLSFTVFDNGVPPLSATVSRTVLITAPCPSGQFYCSGTCLQISCAASAALAAAAVTPVISLTSIPAAVFGSTSGGSTRVAYGTSPSFPLTPCSSYSECDRPCVCWHALQLTQPVWFFSHPAIICICRHLDHDVSVRLSCVMFSTKEEASFIPEVHAGGQLITVYICTCSAVRRFFGASCFAC